MRIGVNTLFLVPGDVGGTEVYLRENLKEMVLASPGDEFVLFTTADNDQALRADLERFDNVSFIRLPFNAAARPLRIAAEQTLLPLSLRKQRVDVLWSPGYTAPLWCPCPQVVTIHDLQYKNHPEDLSFLERITLDFLVKNSCKICESVIAVSAFSKREIVRFNFAPENKIQVIYEGVDPSFGEPTDRQVSEFIELPAETPYILCIAHTYPHKNIHLLIDAFAALINDIPHHLVLVGKARRGEPLVQERLLEIPEPDRVHRIHSLSREELRIVYQGADMFVLPSLYEGFGLPVLEALLAGIPTVISHRASLPEVGGDCAIYFNENDPCVLAEKIKELISLSTEGRALLRQCGMEWVKKFSWKGSAQGTIAELKRAALGQHGRNH